MRRIKRRGTFETTAQRLAREIRAWDWHGIKRDAEASAEPDDECDGMLIGRSYLGSVFSLTPSGKMYAPFACSNVMGCPGCNGRGMVRNPERNGYRHAALKQRRDVARSRKRFGVLGIQHADVERFRPFVSCDACGGLGSREAHLDEMWHEILEDVAGEHDIGIEWRDGDCFATVAVDAPEESEADDTEAA